MKPTLAFSIPETPEFDIESLEGVSQKHMNLVYGTESKDQVLDIYLPELKKEKIPLIIYLHEGAFAFGSKRDKRAATLFAALKRGYAIASVDYRKSKTATWPAPVYDVKAAIRFLRASADRFHLDDTRFAIWGMSAGAYYGSMVAVTNNNPGFEDLNMGYRDFSSSIQAAVDLCGACSGFHHLDEAIRENGFGRANHDAENSPESILMGNPLQEIRELNHLAAPITYVKEDTPPFFIMHSKKDPVVPVQQSLEFAGALTEVLGEDKVRTVFLEGQADHGKPDYNTDEVVRQALDFLDEVLGKTQTEE